MLMLFTNKSINNHQSWTYAILQFATMCFGPQFERLATNNFNGDADEEDHGWRPASIPILGYWLNNKPIPIDKQISGGSMEIIGKVLKKLRNLIETLRNRICTLYLLTLFGTHYMFAKYPLEDIYPDFWYVFNIFMSMLFFCLMTVYAHCLMYEETIRFSKSV